MPEQDHGGGMRADNAWIIMRMPRRTKCNECCWFIFFVEVTCCWYMGAKAAVSAGEAACLRPAVFCKIGQRTL